MLKLTANNKTLDITGISFQITRRAPFADNSGSFVYNFTIPYTENNARIFGFPLRLQRLQKLSAEIPGEISFNGKLIQKGVWTAKSSERTKISVAMKFDAGEFNAKINGKKLADIFDVPISEADIVAHVNSQVTKTWPEVNHNFPSIYNPKFYGDPTETDTSKNPNPYFLGVLNLFENNVLKQNTSGNENAIAPQLYLAYMIQHIYESQGYHLKGDVLNDEMIQRAMIYCNYALDKVVSSSFSGAFSGLTASPDFIIIPNKNIIDPQSNYNPSTGGFVAAIAGNYTVKVSGTFKPTTIATDGIYVFTVNVFYNGELKGGFEKSKDNNNAFDIDHTFNIDVSETGHEITVAAKFTEDPYQADVINSSIIIANTTPKNLNIFTGDFNYKDIVPNMLVSEFIKDFIESFNILQFIEESTKTVELIQFSDYLNNIKLTEFPEGLIKDSLKVYSNNYQGVSLDFEFQGNDDLLSNKEIPEDNLGSVLTAIPLPWNPNEIYFIEMLNGYYQYQYNSDTSTWEWVCISNPYLPFVEDDGKKKISIPFSPMVMRKPFISFARNYPSISAQGTSFAYQLKNDAPLRIMFWVGLSDWGVNADFPQALTIKWNSMGDVVLPISWTEEDVANRYFSDYITWLKNRLKIEFSNTITPAQLSKLRFTQKFLFQNTKILLEETYTHVSNNALGPVDVTGWSV